MNIKINGVKRMCVCVCVVVGGEVNHLGNEPFPVKDRHERSGDRTVVMQLLLATKKTVKGLGT